MTATHSTTPASTRAATCTVDIKAPADHVWRALTEAREVARWFAPRVTGSGEQGGTLVLDWGNGVEWHMPVLRADPHRLLVVGDAGPIGHERQQTGADTGAVRIEYALQAVAGGVTRLTVTHSGFGTGPGWDEMYDGVNSGWFYELRSLRHYVERFFGRDRRIVSIATPISATREAVWERVMGALGVAPGDVRIGATIGALVRSETPEAMEIFQARPARELAAIVPSMGDAMVRFAVEKCTGQDRMLWVWLSSHAGSASEAEAFERVWRSRTASISG
jgi:uncharacterized protein YndB with AHSA1/START domain